MWICPGALSVADFVRFGIRLSDGARNKTRRQERIAVGIFLAEPAQASEEEGRKSPGDPKKSPAYYFARD